MQINVKEDIEFSYKGVGPYTVVTVTLEHSEVPLATGVNDFATWLTDQIVNRFPLAWAIKTILTAIYGELRPDLHNKDKGFGLFVITHIPLGGIGVPYSVVEPRGVANSMLLDRRVFNKELYLNIYSDLIAAFGGNTEKAKAHWKSDGLREGRRASTAFDSVYYLRTYPDLFAAFGESGYGDALVHWLTFGIGEGRRSAAEFDAQWYLNNHGDLLREFGAGNYAAAVEHWFNFGLREGRASSAEFNIRHYLERYPDLVSAFGKTNYPKAFEHWLAHGRAEGRVAA